MPPQLTATQTRLKNITTCLTITVGTLEMLADTLKIPMLEPIFNTTQSLLKGIETVKQNKSDCADLMEKTHNLLNAIIVIHIKSDTGTDLPPTVLKHIGKFTETLHKIHTFVEAQQKGSKIKKFFRQGEISILLTECNAGVQDGVNFFQIHTGNLMAEIAEMQENARRRHQEVLDMVETLSEITSSDRASSINTVYSGSHNSSTSISMLPSEPKIFHGRESELSYILNLFGHVTPRIAILGAGGMGKTSLARAVVHHTQITIKYEQHRVFVACDSATTKVELAALIGAHLGLKPCPDLTRPVIQHFSSSPPSLLILDNLETLWEPAESRGEIEEFLSLLTEVDHLALMITMRGAERPAKIAWTRPFLQPLKPLDQKAARRTFIDIADAGHSLEEVDKVLSLSDNLPLAISLLAHLVDSEGCSTVLSRWEQEKTSLISEGFDKRSNLDLSISLSLSSPRIESLPQSRDLLSLLSILPDGLTDTELVQSKLPIDDILRCKATLIRTSLAYSDECQQLKVLVPIREYMQRLQPPGIHLIQPLLKHFQEMLEFYMEYHGTQSGPSIVGRLWSNFSNIQNILQNGLQQGHPNLKDSIYATCNLNSFSQHIGQGTIPLIHQIRNFLPQLHDHQLEAYFITEFFGSQRYYAISDVETLVAQYLKHFEQVDDTDLKCRFYSSIADYYQLGTPNGSLTDFMTLQGTAGFLAITLQPKNMPVSLKGWPGFAEIFTEKQRHSILKLYACTHLVTTSKLGRAIMNDQAEIRKLKSEYLEARNIHSGLLQVAPIDQDPYNHAFALLNIAEIDVSIGTPKESVQRNIQTARMLFNTRGLNMEVIMCETILADLCLREGNTLEAESLLMKCIKSSTAQPQMISYCLERLGDISRWKVPHCTSTWTTVYLVHSIKCKEKLGIYKALQFLGDIFLVYDEEETAISLFTVALEAFTWMDVHHSRAECMLRLGDILKGNDDLLKAVELWEAARSLFEKSSQAKQVKNIDERLASIGEDVLKQHQKNLACLAELNAPSGAVENLEDDLSDMEDLQNLALDEGKEFNLVSV
ncbi:hypothetical protein B0H13DRAFT_1901465 [Mycena leptocephala]|nr:hypothetical protein B0H13DRAFT_1901465 [Mycena leptocephala]